MPFHPGPSPHPQAPGATVLLRTLSLHLTGRPPIKPSTPGQGAQRPGRQSPGGDPTPETSPVLTRRSPSPAHKFQKLPQRLRPETDVQGPHQISCLAREDRKINHNDCYLLNVDYLPSKLERALFS